ncbi:MAG TPA: nucleotide exchange factor GrpE [Porphyromonadaceae bacterium]|nr:nucleotide exchange factor GrpE [Porphyromonadaceae bacterium]
MSSDKNYNDKNYEPENLGEGAETIDVDPSEEVQPEGAEVAADEEISEIETLKNLLQAKETEVEKEKKEYLFLMAEFDNFRKRTIRERSELVKNASEKALQGLLPIVDDFERGLDAIRDSSDAEAVKEGMNLIYNKLIKYLADNGVKAMESTGADFDTELHEAVAMVPADDVTPKGKVKDTVSKGYTINDKVLRHAKVVVAQ